MPMYEVILEAVLHASVAHTTHDVIEADDAAAAEEKAVEAWTRVEPRLTFRPLLTVQIERNGAEELALDAELRAEAATTQDERDRWLRIASQWWEVA
jgi:hypothetical protein